MFETLLDKHHIITETMKQYTFEDEQGFPLSKELRGYFAVKESEGRKKKYFIDETLYKKLPIKINKAEEIFYKEGSRSKSIILLPKEITPFRIHPEKTFTTTKEMIDAIASFNHSRPEHWTLNKIIAIMSYVGKTFTGICSISEFGKSSIYLILDAITKKCPVFQPRSVPGILAQITRDGNMIFDEVHDVNSEVKTCMEDFSLRVGDNNPVYINGALRAKNTKQKYDVSQQSITYLYNIWSNYSDPSKQFWNNIWANRKAIESRFLCLKLEGKLEEAFDKNFSIPAVAEENKTLYIKIAKHLLYLKDLKINNEYSLRYAEKGQKLPLKGRHKIIYEEILWGIDSYSESQEEYLLLLRTLNDSIVNYSLMVGGAKPVIEIKGAQSTIVPVDVSPGNDREKILKMLDTMPIISIEELEKDSGVKDIDSLLVGMLKRGEVYEPKKGFIGKL